MLTCRPGGLKQIVFSGQKSTGGWQRERCARGSGWPLSARRRQATFEKCDASENSRRGGQADRNGRHGGAGVGCQVLSRLDRVSSVSDGSITGGVLGMNWERLQFDGGVASNLVAQLIAPVRRLAGTTIDQGALLRGVLLPGSVADRAVGAYRKHLFRGATLQDLPAHPRFIINATNIQTGALWRFLKRHMA